MNKKLTDALGIEPVAPKQEILEPVRQEILEPSQIGDAEADYNLARQTFRNLIQQGNLAMEDMKELARQSESPRAYEVFATMMKTISETTKDLYALQKTTKELKEVSNKTPQGDITVEKAVFVGTTADLLKKIKEEK